MTPVSLADYKVVMDSAYAAFAARDRRSRTPRAPGDHGFPIPAIGFRRRRRSTPPNSCKLIRTYRARFRANVARTPAERAAVNWDARDRRCAEWHHGRPLQHHQHDERPRRRLAPHLRRRNALAPDAAVHHRHGRRVGQLRRVDQDSRWATAAPATSGSSWSRPTFASRRERRARRSRPTSRFRIAKSPACCRASGTSLIVRTAPINTPVWAGAGRTTTSTGSTAWATKGDAGTAAQRNSGLLPKAVAGHAPGRGPDPEGSVRAGGSAHQRDARQERSAGDHRFRRHVAGSGRRRIASRRFRNCRTRRRSRAAT